MEDIAKKMSEDEIKVLQKTISILSEHKVTGDLEKARTILQKNFGKGGYPYPYPVKKSIPKWTSAQRAIFGYSDEDLENCDYEGEEVEKSSKNNPFPSLTKVFNRNIQNVEEFIETENIESRFV